MSYKLKALSYVLLFCGLSESTLAESTVSFRRIELDSEFRSEGVAIADVDKDGDNDVIVGDYWYRNPDWKPHEIRPPRAPNRGGYTEAFAVYANDFNQDGWSDILVVPFHGKDAKWYENPQNKEGHWPERIAFQKTGNETRLYLDLFEDENPVFLMSVEGNISWVEVAEDATSPWVVHRIDNQGIAGGVYHHGLGMGDLNGDGRNDVLSKEGWWEQPQSGRQHKDAWKFHRTKLGPDCADMHVADLDLDGRNDVISSSAHGRGIWWHQQTGDPASPEFKTHTLDESIKETHSLNYVDVDGDGKRDLVTGWRFYAHGFHPDKAHDPSELAWFSIATQKGKAPTLVKRSVDFRSGVGAQFVTSDFNGDELLDIVVSNRKGVFVFLQERPKD